MAEAGIAGYEAALWVAFVMPAATPPAIVAPAQPRDERDPRDRAKRRDALVAQGIEPEAGPPQAVTERIRTDIEKWRGVVAKAGIGVRRGEVERR